MGALDGLRRSISWLAAPTAYAAIQVALQTRCGVLSGPFAGMRYPPSFVPAGLFAGPYQVGSFECELHPIIERIVASEPRLLINVGSAQGYYSIGLGRAVWELSVIAYELDPQLRAAAARIGELNEVQPRVDARGLCTVAELAGLASHVDGTATCLLMDCEGQESELVDPERVPWLAEASLLVELHPGVVPGVRERLSQRLEPTHELEIVRGEPRWAGRFPELYWVRGLRQIDREILIGEFRQGIGEWLWAVPRGGGR